jgi:Bacterial protein of unknown function (HtrL_YibB)
MSHLTFVTCFLDAYEDTGMLDTNPQKQLPERIARFQELAETGIHICLYTTANVSEYIQPVVEENKNVHWKVINLKDTFTWKTVHTEECSLPEQRSAVKDNVDFMVVQNCKPELMEQTIQENPWNSTHFAWIDFSIFYVFKEPVKSAKWLQFLSTATFAPRFLTFPGCSNWDRLSYDRVEQALMNRVYWRFCGGFFIGDKDSLLQFTKLYRMFFPAFIQTYKRVVWEVNVWAWLETVSDWRPTLYSADHNDSILYFTADFCVKNMRSYTTTYRRYPYPSISQYQPSSASYIEWRGQRFLNTRYVNYLLYDNGSYHIHSPDGRTLDTMNFISILDEYGMPLDYDRIDETTQLTDYLERAKRFVSRGFEDIRLFESIDGKVKFVATTIQYSPLGQNRMVLGEYDIFGKRLNNVRLVEPPDAHVWCEKNWIPVRYQGEDCFIYGWSPFQVGRVVEGAATMAEFPQKLEIILRREYRNTPFLNHIRGSSVFVKIDGNRLVGLVHYSEEYVPRHYYHLLVQLDADSLEILEYTNPFIFQQIGIEFCIGFAVEEKEYSFWISQMDRNPVFVKIPKEEFLWNEV